MNRNSRSSSIHSKWLVLIVLILVGYGLFQPVLNGKFGWSLPSLVSLLSEDSKELDAQQASGKQTSRSTEGTSTSERASSSDRQSTPGSKPTSHRQSDSTNRASDPSKDEFLHFGLLRETGRSEFTSPAGLRYTRGSEEGHRLDHLARHLEDQPDRPGRHGVFRGDMHQVLLWLDEAYNRAIKGDRGTKTRVEDGRSVIEVTFDTPIGFIGGRDGARQSHPDSIRLRMVVDGDRVITAFPF